MIYRPLFLAAVSMITVGAFAQSVLSNRTSGIATTAIENVDLAPLDHIDRIILRGTVLDRESLLEHVNEADHPVVR